MSALPDAEPQNPACGVCRGETRCPECDQFVCEDCGLAFDAMTMEAEFLDPDAEVCGAACDNYWHGDHKIGPGKGFECGTCQLPKGHTSMHWTGCMAVEIQEVS